MTTLRIEVGRCSGTTVEDVIKGLRQAGCMSDIGIYPESMAFLPIEELRAALIGEGFDVEDLEDPPPPPLPWWRLVRAYPRRAYYWLRRVFLRESTADQFLRVLYPPERVAAIHRISMRESPRKVRKDTERGE